MLEDEVGRYKAEALVVNSVMEENDDHKVELETARKAASEAAKEAKEAIKEAKEKKEELRTCHLDRDYHAHFANQKSSLVDDLQINMQAQTTKCKQLTAEVESLKESHAKTLAEQAGELKDAKDAIKICFYMFWKHNRNANFSYLGDAYAADEAECLERLPEEEAEAATAKKPLLRTLTPKNFILKFLLVLFWSNT